MRSLNLDHLHTFEAVIEFGSFSLAADRLSLTQPAVSLQVKQLETRLGVCLVERVGRKVRATAAGAELLAHITNINNAVARATEAMSTFADGVAGRVRLGTGATACIYLLPPLLRRLRHSYPELEIVVSNGNTSDILRSVEENRIDIGLVTLPAGGRIIKIDELIDDEMVAISALDDFRIPSTITARNLANLPVVLYEHGGSIRKAIDDWLSSAGVSVDPIMELGNVEAIKEMAGAGLGCGIVPRMSLRDGELMKLRATPLMPPLFRKLGLIQRRDKPPSKALHAIVQALSALGGRHDEKAS